MKKKIKINKTIFFFIGIMAFKNVTAQYGSYDVVSLYGNYSFSGSQVPDNLVSVNPSLGGGGMVFQWEKSYRPLDGFTAIPGGTYQTYTFSTAITQTTYYRRKLTVSGNIFYSNTLKIEAVSINWENFNYVREHDILIPSVSTAAAIDVLPIGQKLQTTTYLDGIGRPLQKISRETATPSDDPNNIWGDVVKFYKYDALGKQPINYLPYTTVSESGKYKNYTIGTQDFYYSNNYGETSPYSTTITDNSPINRPINVKSPGTSWAAGLGNSAVYDINDINENVQQFTIAYTTGAVPVSLGAYPSNTLYKMVSIDENGKQTIEYINKSGQSILVKKQLAESGQGLTVAHDGWICTYSVYDDFGLLRYRFQPEAVKWLDQHAFSFAGTAGQNVLDELCFRYEYDEKGRTILKKAPGAKELYMIYDKRDRVVFMQDGNQRNISQWTANIYDDLDRQEIATLYNTSKTKANLLSDIDNAGNVGSITVSAQSITMSTYNNPIVSADINNTSVSTIVKYNFYDTYSYTGVKSFNTSFDNLLAYPTGSEPIITTQRTLSMPTGAITRVLGTTTFLVSSVYYDDKGRAIQTTEDNIKTGTDVTTLQYQWDGRELSSNTKHTTTNTGYTNFSIVTKNLFDKLGRVISIQKKYGSNAFKTIANYTFDDMGRLKNKKLDPDYNNTTTGKTGLESLDYSYNIHNEITGINKNYALKTPNIGTLFDKWQNYFGLYLGYDNKEGQFLSPQLDGHVTGTMWNTQGDDTQRKFDFSYDNAGRLINALFAEKQPASGGGGDGGPILISPINGVGTDVFTHGGGGTVNIHPIDPPGGPTGPPPVEWSNTVMDFSVTGNSGKIEYDLNGNLLNMIHRGILPAAASPYNIDNLTYTYAPQTNKLVRVTDNGDLGTNNGKLGDFKDGTNTGDDYVYDDNGNLVIDLNKNAVAANGTSAGIKYNFLDKPEEIHIAGKGTITMVYDADGNKLQRTYTPEGTTNTKTTTYINQFVYEGDYLQYINFEEGRIRVMQTVIQSNGFDYLNIDGNADLLGGKRGTYDYFIRDYQANIRMILTEETHTGSNSCTMELNRDANEAPLFGQVDANGNPNAQNEVQARFPVSSIPGQGTANGGWQNAAIGNYVSRVGNLASSTIGPNTLLKVMAGDQISASTIYYYKDPVPGNTSNTGVNNLVQALLGAMSGSSVTSGTIKGSATDIAAQLQASIPLNTTTNPGTNYAGAPYAYLTLLFFDERFNFVAEGSQALPVQNSGNSTYPLILDNIKAPKNGYAFVYVSNVDDEMVYFDNLQVTQEHARIIEEDHYYAYGLKIAGISSHTLPDPAEGGIKNNNLYNDKELIDDGDLDWYDYGFRNYDAQIGRFPQLDPLTDDYPYLAPYQYASCDPITNIDVDGLEGWVSTGAGVARVESLSQVVITNTAKVSGTALQIGRIGLSLGINGAAAAVHNEQSNVLKNLQATAFSQASSQARMTSYTPSLNFAQSWKLLNGLTNNTASTLLFNICDDIWISGSTLKNGWRNARNMEGDNLIGTYGAANAEKMRMTAATSTLSLMTPIKFDGEVVAKGGTRYFRGGSSFEMSAADLRSSVDKTTGLMKQRGLSLNTNHLDPFVQKYGGAWELNLNTVPKELKIKFTSGTHFELVPKQTGMSLQNYQNLIKQVQIYPFNIWPK